MIRRSTRLTAIAGVSVVALAGIGVSTGASASAPPSDGWAVDTSDCPDPDAVNAPIEGQIIIGSAMPLSGGAAAAAFEPAARGFRAYVNYANANGLLPGVEIVADIQDDQYNPANTPGAVSATLDAGASLIAGLIGTGGSLAVRDTLNEECIPMLNLLTGAPEWGDEIADYPWTTGLLTSYRWEFSAYAQSIAENFPDTPIGVFYNNSEFGAVSVEAFTEAADEQGLSIESEQTIEVGDEAPPTAQVSALADAGVGVIVAVPLGIQCVTFLNEVAAVKAQNPDWAPQVYITNTCASALILGVAGEAATGLYTSASMGLRDVGNPEVAAEEPVASYIAEMEAQGLGDIITTGGAGWNAAEVTVQILIDAQNSPDGLTRASIINAARNLNYHPTLLRDGMNYVMNGEEDGFYSEDIQIVQWDGATGIFTDIGEVISYESSPDAGEPTVAAPIVVGQADPLGTAA
jgi:ABC-type branched-subunit amino acid transport system substrate-binding protein